MLLDQGAQLRTAVACGSADACSGSHLSEGDLLTGGRQLQAGILHPTNQIAFLHCPCLPLSIRSKRSPRRPGRAASPAPPPAPASAPRASASTRPLPQIGQEV